MLIHAYMINEGDTLVTDTWQDGCKVAEVEVYEDDSVRVKYVTGSMEWFSKYQLVVKRV